jgi:hypothetical protein
MKKYCEWDKYGIEGYHTKTALYMRWINLDIVYNNNHRIVKADKLLNVIRIPLRING